MNNKMIIQDLNRLQENTEIEEDEINKLIVKYKKQRQFNLYSVYYIQTGMRVKQKEVLIMKKKLRQYCQAPESVCRAQESCDECVSIHKEKAIGRSFDHS